MSGAAAADSDAVHPIAPDVRARILDALRTVEAEHDVEIVFACESGSRGWGFSSPDSDYDVRFVYRHRAAWYLTATERRGPRQPQRDVIELPIDATLDVGGWDLRKALRLLDKSNPTLSEWLRSPVVYRQDPATAAELVRLAERFYSPIRAWHHYLSMARGNHRGYLQGARVRSKKYLYVLRPLLACRWIERSPQPPPMAFETLLDALLPDGPVREAVDALLVRKRRSRETADGPRIAEISDFIEREFVAMTHAHPPHLGDAPGRAEELDTFLRAAVGFDAG